MGLIDRLFGARTPDVAEPTRLLSEPKRLLLPDAPVADSPEVKSSLALLPAGAYGEAYPFFSPDGGRTMIDFTEGPTALAFVAYWYVATRWRAQKIAEPPLMVVQEDQKDGTEDWISNHELVPVLEEPSPDFDMGELLEMTSLFLDNSGAALWVKDTDTVGRVARIMPFSRNQFEPKRSDTRLYDRFDVQTAEGKRTYTAEQCVFFRDVHGGGSWGRGKSRLDVAMSWLKLSARAQQTIYDLLTNSLWPSGVVTTHPEWDPDLDTYKQFRQDVEKYGKAGNKGRPFIALGGGNFTPLQSEIKDIVPGELLGRVESIVSAISGCPAIVLQFQIGMENSPWSQMEEARKMAYHDTITPTWRKWERMLTRQLLRPIDDDPTHFMRFDDSNVAALQQNQLEQVQIATGMGRAASLNERRTIMGLEPVDKKDDPEGRADEIPELVQPSIAELLAGAGGSSSTDNPSSSDSTTPPDPAKKARPQTLERKMRAASLLDAFRDEAVPFYEAVALKQLATDARRISEIVMHTLLDESDAKSLEVKRSRGKETTMKAVQRYLAEDGRKAWTRSMQPLNEKAATQSGALVASDMNLNFSLLHGNLLTYARKQTGSMITKINETTRSLISDIIQGGIDAQKPTREIARVITEATGFTKARATLIARTETTKAFNGAPTESLSVLAQSGDRSFTKTWSGVLDDRERDEHVAMEGETVGIDEEFSNGLQYPSEPNCRCVLLYDETTDD